MGDFERLDNPDLVDNPLNLEGVEAPTAGKLFTRQELFSIVSDAVRAVLDERESKQKSSADNFDVVDFINTRYGNRNRWLEATPTDELIENWKECGRMSARAGLTVPDEHFPDKPAFYKTAFRAGEEEGRKWSDAEYYGHFFKRLEETMKKMRP